MKKIAIYSSHSFEVSYLVAANKEKHELIFINEALCIETVSLCMGCMGIAVFTSDDVSAEVLDLLAKQNIEFITTRSTGFDHIDLQRAKELGIAIAHVPGYSPNAIAEHTIALILALNRKIILSHEKVNDFDFRIDELIGFNLQGKTVGIIGAGKIGAVVCKILHGFGCKLIVSDINEDKKLVNYYNVHYTNLKELLNKSDIISLHAPLSEATNYIINAHAIAEMKNGVMLINTSRGKVVNTIDVLHALNDGHISYYGADVYENEQGVFFKQFPVKGIADPVLQALIRHKHVLLTAHQAFLTKEALYTIATMTIKNITSFIDKIVNPNLL
ncbi:MAG: 2-hydroxyacid dehydrogenase [Ferruginibacter sp.]